MYLNCPEITQRIPDSSFPLTVSPKDVVSLSITRAMGVVLPHLSSCSTGHSSVMALPAPQAMGFDAHLGCSSLAVAPAPRVEFTHGNLTQRCDPLCERLCSRAEHAGVDGRWQHNEE